ncbi:hypothetical protein GOP47_0023093 [Adiantum capillus-veneris]|uniref:Ribosomal protein n=1 Tax=Adiantum capillus-veneris TaxID=13818 RepID=A0A9D4U6N2_ADICA|nr:hypothetical protein GOP47_0023093 [Adiantum capillus-veneris]
MLQRLARRVLSTQRSLSPRPLFFCTNNADADKGEDSPIPIVSYAPKSTEEEPSPPPTPRRDRRQDVVISADDIAADMQLSPSFSSSTRLPAAYEVKPKVAPLPEYHAAPEEPSLEGEPSQQRLPSIRQFVPEDLLNVPLPVRVKVETQPRPNPIPLMDAIRKVKSKRSAKFDETVEAAIRLGVDPKRSDQLVRGAATLPHGSGKTVRVAVFAEDEDAEEAKSAGADVVGAEELINIILKSGGKLDFDKCVATPSMMPKLSKVARILGPRGLMPNPKVGTVTKNVGSAVKSLKQGRVDFRADKTGIVHAGVGKMSFTENALQENIAAFAHAVLAAKPVGLKKTSRYEGYMLTIAICSTMGPGVRVTISSVSQACDNYAKMLVT